MKKGMFLLSTAVIGLTIGLSSCGNETSKEKNEIKEIEKAEPLKIGDKFEGGYIFFLDFEGKHGKICAPRFEGDEKKLDHVSSVEAVKKMNLNGYSDWRLPSMDELTMIINLKRNDLFGFVSQAGYWTKDKGENTGEFWELAISSDLETTERWSLPGIENDPSSYDANVFNYKVVRDF